MPTRDGQIAQDLAKLITLRVSAHIVGLRRGMSKRSSVG